MDVGGTHLSVIPQEQEHYLDKTYFPALSAWNFYQKHQFLLPHRWTQQDFPYYRCFNRITIEVYDVESQDAFLDTCLVT
jgi:hypothetical protein